MLNYSLARRQASFNLKDDAGRVAFASQSQVVGIKSVWSSE